MPLAGSIDTVTLDLVVYGPDTVATLTVYRPDGSSITVDTLPSNGNRTWRARVPYTMPGLWRLDWQVTGTGEGRPPRPVIVSVGPAVAGVDQRHTYANTLHLANAWGKAVPLDAERLLRDASAQVDELLFCAVYPVDDEGMPTEARHVEALRAATCAVVKWRDESGYDATEGAVITSASIAGVSLGFKPTGGQDAPPDGAGSEARQILREAGLLSQGPGGY